MKFCITFIFLSVLVYSTAFSQNQQPRSVTVVDSPTAYTIGRGAYDISFLAYNNGGIEFKSFIGLPDNILFWDFI